MGDRTDKIALGASPALGIAKLLKQAARPIAKPY